MKAIKARDQKSNAELFEKASFSSFLRDKICILLLALMFWIIAILFLAAFKIPPTLICFLSILSWSFVILVFAIEFLRRRNFYRNFLQNLAELDQAYLVLETIEQPNFYDGKIFFDAIYEINKSMEENIKKYHTQSREFQEYVEMWIHEVKTPLATLSLLAKDPKKNEQIKRLDDCVEQILYLSRAENAERDYIISAVPLTKIIGAVANRNRAMLQARNIDFAVENVDHKIQTDGKWLEFMLNQIIANSVKYHSNKIVISGKAEKNKFILSIWDNGIGIDPKDLPRVFEKSFTGANGHNTNKSTGMGLYIVKTMCQKLGHQVAINSVKNQYTEIQITFDQNKYYDVVS